MTKTWPGVVPALFAVLLAGCDIEPATISGQLSFDSASGGGVSNYLVEHPPGNGRVYAYPLNADNELANSALDTGAAVGLLLADYELNLVVGANASPDLRLGVPALVMQAGLTDLAGPRYRFGPRHFAAPNQHSTGPVSAGAAVDLDIIECASLATLRIRLTGNAEDLDALNEPAAVAVTAFVQEDPGDPGFRSQASSAVKTALVAQLRGPGVELPVLFRSGLSVRFGAMVGATSEDPGFPAIPQGGADLPFPDLLSVLPGEPKVFLGAVEEPATTSCGEGPLVIDLAVPVERLAGAVDGLVDVVGKDEERLRVSVEPIGMRQQMALAPAEAGPHSYAIQSIPAGTYDIEAQAVMDDGRSIVRFALPDGVGDITVVPEGEPNPASTGAMFVSPFHTLSVPLRLSDPGPESALASIIGVPFDGIFASDTSYVAVGGEDFQLLEDGELVGFDARAARSWAVVAGEFDLDAGEALLNAQVPLVGLGLKTSPGDGSGARQAFYRAESLYLELNDQATLDQEIIVSRTSDNPGTALFRARLHGEAGVTNSTLPEHAMCFGELIWQLGTGDPEFGLFNPRLNITGSAPPGNFDLVENEGRPVDYRARTSGYRIRSHLNLAEEANPSVALRAALPAFLDYEVEARMGIRNFNNDATSDALFPESMSIPYLRCGERRTECKVIDPDSGALVDDLSARIVSPSTFCEAQSQADVEIAVTSQATPIDEVSLELPGSGQSTTVCNSDSGVPCNNTVNGVFQFDGLAPGSHWLILRVSAGACTAEDRVLLNINSAPALRCLPDLDGDEILTVRAPDEQGISFAQAQAQLGERAIGAVWEGACADPNLPPIQSDAPAFLPVSIDQPTTVRFFTAEGGGIGAGQSCERQVEVEPPGACVALTNLPVGPLPGGDLAIGYASFRPLGSGLWRTTDFYPPGGADGNSELAVSTGLEVDLPFEAPTLRLRYVRANSQPVRLEGFNELGNLVHTWESPPSSLEGLSQTYVITGPPRSRLHITGADNEAFLLELCYFHTLPPGSGGAPVLP